MVVRRLLDGERLYTHTAILFTPQLQTAAADRRIRRGVPKAATAPPLSARGSKILRERELCRWSANFFSPLLQRSNSTSASAANNYLARQGPY